MKQLNFQLLVDGNDLTDYVVSMERNHSMCNPVASLDIVLAPNLPIAIIPYQDVIFYEDGTKTFTGYSQENIAARLPVEVSMRCADVLVRAQDTWFTGPLVAHGEGAMAWIKKFLKKAGLTNISNDTVESYPVYPGYGWEYTTAWDAVVSIMKMCPYQIFADRNGVVCITQLRSDVVDYTINSYISYDRVTNDCWIRNRAVVYGNGFVSDKSETSSYLLPGEIRAAIVATGQIHNPALADSIATRMIQEFRDPLDIKVIEVEGNPNYEVAQIVDFTDPETGYHKNNCVITGINTIMNAEDGYVTEITLDEKCVSFWGWDEGGEINPELVPGEGIIYTGMTNRGVYRSHSNWRYGPNAHWFPFNSGLSGDALTVYDIKTALNGNLWATTEDNLYKREVDSLAWKHISIPLPDEWTGGGFPTLAGVCPSTKIASDVFMLAYGSPDGVDWVWLYHRDGSTWTAYPIGAAPSGGYWEDLDAGGADGAVRALLLSSDGTRLYAAGSFTTIGGITSAIAYLDETGWHNVCTAANNDIFCLALDSLGNLYAGGDFTDLDGIGGADYIAKYDGNNWSAMGLGIAWKVNVRIAAIAIDVNDVVYAGGYFDWLGNGSAANNVAKFAGGAWSSMGNLGLNNGGGVYDRQWPDPFPCAVPELNSNVWTLLTVGTTCYLGGEFDYVNGVMLPECVHATYWDGAAWNMMPGFVFPPGVIGVTITDWTYDTITSTLYGVSGTHIYPWDGANWGTTLPDDGVASGGEIYISGDFLFHVGNKLVRGGFGVWNLRDEEWVETLITDHDFVCVRPWGDIDPYLQRQRAVCGGVFPNGAAYDYITQRNYLDYRVELFDHYGDTHGLDADHDGEYVFVPLKTQVAGNDYIHVMRIAADLARKIGDIEEVFDDFGAWCGVLCDPYEDDRVWIFGDLSGNHLYRSDTDGDFWSWKGEGVWGANEMVAAIIPTTTCSAQYIAILNDVMESWITANNGDDWTKEDDTNLIANFGRLMPDEVGAVIGTEGLDPFTLQYAPFKGGNWEEQSYKLPSGERMANLCWGVEDE